METYNTLIVFLSMAGFFLTPAVGVINWIMKKTAKNFWIFGYLFLFFLFTAVRHAGFSIAYDDPADPNYASYKNWTLLRLIWSDICWLFIWLGIGTVHYFAWIKKKKWVKWLMLGGIAGCFILLAVCSVFSMA